MCVCSVSGVWLFCAGSIMEKMVRPCAKFVVPWAIMVELCLKLKQSNWG